MSEIILETIIYAGVACVIFVVSYAIMKMFNL
jgi:hypothetical protein